MVYERYWYFKKDINSNHLSGRKCKGLSDEINKPATASNNNLAPELNHNNTKLRVKLDRSCLKQEKNGIYS